MKVVGIIQARMGSSRLPGKMMMDLNGRPVVTHVFDRAKKASGLAEVWLATTISSQDDVLADWAANYGVPCFRGSESDVLDRYYQCAKEAGADVIVRLTGDCPLLDPSVIDKVIAAFLVSGVDYASNVHPPTYPDGLDTEVCTFAALEKAHREAILSSEREHVTPYIWKNTNLFSQINVENNIDVSAERWTLDTPEDLVYVRLLVQACEQVGDCSLASVLSISAKHPEWKQVQRKHTRNEGYVKSIREDKRNV